MIDWLLGLGGWLGCWLVVFLFGCLAGLLVGRSFGWLVVDELVDWWADSWLRWLVGLFALPAKT